MQSLEKDIQLVRETTKTFKSFIRDNQVQQVESLQESLRSAIENSCDIAEVFSEELTPMLDEGELEDELKSMMLTESINRSFPTIPDVPLPSSPLAKHVSSSPTKTRQTRTMANSVF